jgi:electron transfer flavoprotein beta subunit
MLALPCISLARGIRVEDGSVVVKRSIPGGYERVKAGMPAVVTVSNEVGELRYISRTKMLSMLKGAGSIPSWGAGDLGLARETLERMGIVALSSPPNMGRDCRFIEGSTDEQAEKLAAVFKALR